MGIYSSAAVNATQPNVRKYIDPVTGEEVDEIVSEGQRQPPIEQVAPPVVVQPAWTNLAGGDPTPVNPNDPALLDRRQMIWQAQEAQRQAAAQAAGQEYKIQENGTGENFKANPGLQFGTKGIARDVIGNAVDFFGSLIGRKPSYRDEKFRDAIYGWDQPGGFEAAINRGMQYDPKLTSEFLKDITGARAVQSNTEANVEYKNASAQQRHLQGVTGLAYGIAMAPDPAQAYAKGGRAALQKMLDTTHGPGVVTLPEEYDADVMSPLVRSGYGGSQVQRERQAVMSDATKRYIAEAGIASREEMARWSNETKLRVAQIAANSRLSAAELAGAIRRAIAEEKEGTEVVNTSEDPGTFTKTYVPRAAISKGQRGTYRGQKGYFYEGRFFPE